MVERQRLASPNTHLPCERWSWYLGGMVREVVSVSTIKWLRAGQSEFEELKDATLKPEAASDLVIKKMLSGPGRVGAVRVAES